MKAFMLICLVAALAIVPGVLLGTTIVVNDDAPGDPGPGDPAISDPLEDGTFAHPFDAIQEGIDAAVDTDTVLVLDGIYTGDGNRDIDFLSKAITVRSLHGPKTCIVDCEGTEPDPHRGFYFHSDETPASAVDGFTITNGYSTYGGGILCYESSPTISKCMITNNSGWYGAGILCSGASPTITNCTITGNSARWDGGGIRFYGGSLTVINCTLVGNGASRAGGAIWYTGGEGEVLTIEACILWDNTASRGHEVYAWSTLSGAPTVRVRWSAVAGGADEMAVDAILDYDASNIEACAFVRPDGHLVSGSPYVDLLPSGPGDDVDGEARPFGSGYDIGADEFVDTDGDRLPDWWELAYFGSPTAAWPWHDSDHDGARDILEYTLGLHPLDPDTDDDGRRDGWELWWGTNPLHPDNREKTYYVDGSTGDDAWDGLAPSYNGVNGPKCTIQAGIDATLTGWGYTVLVADGTYAGDGNHDLDFGGRAITVKSENGPDTCLIDCEGSGRGFHFRSYETAASVVDGFTITNGCADYGGGIYCYDSNATIADCTIADTWASRRGGAISCRFGGATIVNCTITDSSAGSNGGGICCEYGDATISNCTITGSSAGSNGGSICCRFGDATISNCTITDSSADYLGGGICCEYGDATISNCTITDSSAGWHGGGICCGFGDATISDCTITDSSAGWHGGGIRCEHGDAAITGCTISGSSAGWDGGGICCEFSGATIANCTIRDSSASWNGGGICCEYGDATIADCTITGNSASGSGGAILCSCGSATITNCTITGNSAPSSGGGVYAGCDCNGTITNCILWADTAPNGHEIAMGGAAVVAAQYCDVQGGAAEVYVEPGCTLDYDASNIDADPLFRDAANGDYRLGWWSPCIDAGTSDGAPERDIVGAPRWDVRWIANTGGGDMPWYDIGAYEFWPGWRWGHCHPHWRWWPWHWPGHGKGPGRGCANEKRHR